MQSYKDLLVWQRSMSLAEGCYRLAAALPRDELYGLSAQIGRAAVSIPANIAEGHGRETTAAFIQFLRIAQGSLKELETHLMPTERLNMTSDETVGPILGECSELGKMMRALIRTLLSKIESET